MEAAIIPHGEVRLNEIKIAVKGAMKRTVTEIIYIGDLLIEAKQIVGHGNWAGWIEANFKTEGLSTSTAGRFMRVARFVRLKQPVNLTNLEPSAAYLITARSAPKQAVGIILGRLAAGQSVTHADAEQVIEVEKIEVIKSYVLAHAPEPIIQRMEAGELAPVDAQAITKELEAVKDDQLREDVIDLGISHPGVIGVMQKIKEKEPNAYEEIVATGHFQGSGDPVPVADANERDAKDHYKEVRHNTHITDWENKFNTIVDTSAWLIAAKPDPNNAERCQATFSMSIDELYKLREHLNSPEYRGGYIRFRTPKAA